MKKIFILFVLLSSTILYAQTPIVVNSLLELKPYMDEDDVNIKLAPGNYFLNAADIISGDWGEALLGGRKVMSFSGNNSTYDFTDVTINFNTDLPSGFASDKGNGILTELHVVGNDNILKNLTMINDGDPEAAPLNSATSIVIDGQRNKIEGFHLTVEGSFPYGYGDAFGKGGGAVISHKKRSAILVRGDYNHLLNTNVITRAYGHGIFMQGATFPTIEGCYVEGALRTTDDMLTEEGTGSPADNVGFITEWGYKLPSGYTLSLSEDGIRVYNSGVTIINGETFSRGTTNNVTVIDCTVKGMRGIALAFGSGHTLTNTSALDNEGGLNIGQGGTLINCVSNNFGIPSNRSGVTADIMLVAYERDNESSNRNAALITGNNHDITIRASQELTNLGFPIYFGGDDLPGGIRNINGLSTLAANNSIINNDSGLLLDVGTTSQNNSGSSCGPLYDRGTNNIISRPNDCTPLDQPFAFYQSLSTTLGSDLAIVLTGFAASPSNEEALNYTVTVQPTNGTLTGTAPNIIYKPAVDFVGYDSFKFTVTDNIGTSDEAIINIEVLGGSLVTFEHTAGATTPDFISPGISASSGLGGGLSGAIATSINQLSAAFGNGFPLDVTTEDFSYYFAYPISSNGGPVTYKNLAIDVYTKHVNRRHQISYIIEGQEEIFLTDGPIVSGNLVDMGNLEYYDFPDFTTTDNVEFRVYWQGSANSTSNGRIYVDHFSINSFSPLMAHTSCGLGGDVFALDEGKFNASSGDFTADVISRLQIMEGFEVEVFTNDDFTGNSNVYNNWGANICVDDTFNNSIKSIIVRNILLDTEREKTINNGVITAYPNPFLTNLHVNLNRSTYHKYSLFSVYGELILKGSISNQTEELNIDVSSLNQGMYILSVKDDTNTIKTLKVIKQ